MPFLTPNELRHVPLSQEQEGRIKDYLDVELFQAEGDRQGLINRLKREVQQYEAVPKEDRKDWPWPDSSNLVVPLIGSMVDTIFPRIYSTIFGVEPVFTFQEKFGDWADNANAFERYFEIVQDKELNLRTVCQDFFMEGIIHGTSVVKLVWDKIIKSVKEYDEDGEIIQDKEREVKNGPALYRVPLEDFYIPMYATSIKDSPWVAHRIRSYWGRLMDLEQSGVYKNVDSIIFNPERTSTDYTREREKLEEHIPSRQEEYELFEVWMDFDYDNDGSVESLIVTYHEPTSTILRTQFNPYTHREKPFIEFVYWPRHDRFYGLGIATMINPIQDEITTIHNQNLDNRTIANTRMWEVVAGSTADRHFDGVKPGRKIKVDRLNEEIQPLQLGEVYPSSREAEQLPLQYAQQRTGVSDFLSGTDTGTGGGRQTATTTMVRMQEARTRFNWTMDSARQALTRIARLTTVLLQQFGDNRNIEAQVGSEDAALIREFLGLGDDDVFDRAGIQVTASSASLNKEAEKQNLISLTQLMNQNTMNFEMPLVNLIMNPQVPEQLKEWAMSKLEGHQKLMERILQTFDARDTDAIMGSLQALEQAISPEPGPAFGQPAAGPAPGAAGAGQQLGMGVPPGAVGG